MKTQSMNQNIEPEFILAGREEEALERCTCRLCGDRLQFMQSTDFLEMKVHEKAECPSCRIQMKDGVHTLQ